MNHFVPVALLCCATITLEAQNHPKTWHLSDQAVLTIGSRDADGPELFGSVVGATRLSSGTVVVADGKSLELRYFSRDGKHLRTSGRDGGGPGEFRNISQFQRCAGDSVFVYDAALFRMSVFSPEGEYTRAGNIRKWLSSGLTPYAFTCNPAGVLVFVNRSTSSTTPPQHEGPLRRDVEIVLVHNDSVVSLGTFPGSEMYFKPPVAGPRHLGKQTTVGVGATSAYVGTADGFEISEFSLHGERIGTVHENRPEVPVTAAQISNYVSDYIATRRNRMNTSKFEQSFRELEWPKTYPAYGQLKVDAADNLWVEEYPIPGSDTGNWTVYAHSGAKLAVISLPKGFRLLEVGRDYALGVWRDEFDVDYVKVYSLVK